MRRGADLSQRHVEDHHDEKARREAHRTAALMRERDQLRDHDVEHRPRRKAQKPRQQRRDAGKQRRKHAEQRLDRWDGFDKSSRRALDGTGFSLTMVTAEGKLVEANGSNAFPKGYAEAKAAIEAVFAPYVDAAMDAEKAP